MMRFHPFAHFGLKLVAVAFAILLWVVVSAQRSSVERGLRIPLELQNLPDNLEMVDPPQDTVDVRVRGAADALGRLVSGDLVASIDLSSAQPGRRLFHLSPDRVKGPFAVEVTQVAPASVAIRFESSATRVVAVQPSVEGEPAPGYIVGEISSQPGTVEVVGPESALRHVSEAITEPVWVGSAKAAVRSTVSLGVVEQGVRLKNTRSAQVQVEIIQAPDTRQLSVPVRMRNLSSGLTAVVAPLFVRVRARGSNAIVEKLKDTSVVAYVDLEGIGEGDYGLPVRLDRTPGVGLDQLDPAVVRIHVQ
jgi:YbbR domain-containing protein